MPKRKREEDPNGATEPNNGAKAQRVRHKLQQGTVKLGHAFKVAKGFERQKLGRRRKNAIAQSNATDVKRIDAEAAAVKIKAVAESPNLPVEVRKPATLSTDTAILNVHARLCNSNPVKEVLPDVLKEIQLALGVKVSKDAGANKKRQRAKDHEALAKGEVKGEARRAETGRGVPNEGSEGSDSEGNEDRTSPDEDDFDKRLACYPDQLASSGDEEDEEDEEGEEDDKGYLDLDAVNRKLEVMKQTKAPSQPKYDRATDLELSDDDAGPVSSSPEPRKAPAPKTSAFLPSLSMGGYISGSGSDIEEIDEAPRKNRRGQRARQQIWEKKYGAKAQHLQKQDRNKGWDPKRGATEAGGGHRGREKSRQADSGANREPVGKKSDSAGAKRPAAVVKEKHRDDEGALHPSWAAAKLAKEKKAAAPVAFQGKKITFD
ncbi:hypothetical protein LTR91_010852 [Friedmanniomyces endolithicus]|uniref:Bud22 domain-containing protein n=1 Tax=Friedmanniomyces endolithicus TaxID=329885 RepID=A0AAN6QRZ2_9PEZI|nr:hypothetical protein LTR94_018952 [Friedmanniomyces endolithicus]KAK0774128.1 hypothetical protein LTR59_014999 [Friedmanniomyces endolithicus]KAK0781872.1 hypothetical protein LTR38_013605 [Friedmanniomyces endolithicus]KAK0796091.1 hypothetical protein LTR75_010320 [Friedmanniomyces endolithicus]KAK0844680.1 hypothetical protein LTS02_015583 [Friedmanniomyces endolithicus]